MFKTIFTVFFILTLFTACSKEKEEQDINIGFTAGLTGKYSTLGTSVRDGFLLAFDQIDYKIGKKHINIIQKDDMQDEQKAKEAIEFFKNNNIKIVVGNVTSSMTEVSVPLVDKYDMLLISPTASSSDFTNKKDNFLRIQVDHAPKRYEDLSKYLLKNGYKNIFFIYDPQNLSYVKDYENMFQNLFIKNGGEKFTGKVSLEENYETIFQSLEKAKHDMVLIVAGSIDTAKIIQYLRLKGCDKKILASGWAKTNDLIQNGGKAVEGVIFNTTYDDDFSGKDFRAFIQNYKQKYGQTPSVFAAQGYELGKILIESLQISTNHGKVKEFILNKKTFQGLQGNIKFNEFGDVNRDYFIMEVKNGRFVKVEE